MIDLHGAPGRSDPPPPSLSLSLSFGLILSLSFYPSQNGYDHSGLIGPVQFAANSSNAERSIAVLRNLTEEFSRSEYGGIVSIELLNEPRVASDVFPMASLKAFYAGATQAIRSASSSMPVMLHDAFWGLEYWSRYDPLSSTASASPSYLSLDQHLYFSFAPYDNLPQATILEKICNSSSSLKDNRTGIAASYVGEWSLAAGALPSSTGAPLPFPQG